MSDFPKLFIPGPTHVSDDILESLSTPQIGHRTPEISDLINYLVTGIQNILYTNNHIYLVKNTNISQANNNSQSLHKLIVINTKKEDYGLWIAAKNRSVELEKNLLNNNRKIEIIEGYSTHPILELPKPLQTDLIEYDFLNLVIFSSRNVSIAKQILENYNLFNIVKNKATLYVNSENFAKKAESLGWRNIKIIKKNFTKEFLDNIIKLP